MCLISAIRLYPLAHAHVLISCAHAVSNSTLHIHIFFTCALTRTLFTHTAPRSHVYRLRLHLPCFIVHHWKAGNGWGGGGCWSFKINDNAVPFSSDIFFYYCQTFKITIMNALSDVWYWFSFSGNSVCRNLLHIKTLCGHQWAFPQLESCLGPPSLRSLHTITIHIGLGLW